MLTTNQDKLFMVLKNDVRRDMIKELLDRDLSPGDFELMYDLSPSAITKHLKILEQAHFVSRYREGRKVMCHLNKRRLVAMKVDWLVQLLV